MSTTWTCPETVQRLALMEGITTEYAAQVVSLVAMEQVPGWAPGDDLPHGYRILESAQWWLHTHPLPEATDEDDRPYAAYTPTAGRIVTVDLADVDVLAMSDDPAEGEEW